MWQRGAAPPRRGGEAPWGRRDMFAKCCSNKVVFSMMSQLFVPTVAWSARGVQPSASRSVDLNSSVIRNRSSSILKKRRWVILWSILDPTWERISFKDLQSKILELVASSKRTISGQMWPQRSWPNLGRKSRPSSEPRQEVLGKFVSRIHIYIYICIYMYIYTYLYLDLYLYLNLYLSYLYIICICLRPENRPSVFEFFLLLDYFRVRGWGGWVEWVGVINVLGLRPSRPAFWSSFLSLFYFVAHTSCYVGIRWICLLYSLAHTSRHVGYG